MDYSPESYEVTFTSGSTRQCTLIDIIDDRTPEPDEMFRVVITPDPDTDPGPNNNTTITIIDNGTCYSFKVYTSNVILFVSIHRCGHWISACVIPRW